MRILICQEKAVTKTNEFKLTGQLGRHAFLSVISCLQNLNKTVIIKLVTRSNILWNNVHDHYKINPMVIDNDL